MTLVMDRPVIADRRGRTLVPGTGSLNQPVGSTVGQTPTVAHDPAGLISTPIGVEINNKPFTGCAVAWCLGDPDWHHDDGNAVHDGPFTVLPMHSGPCERHAGPAGGEVWLALEREDENGLQGTTHVYLAPTSADPSERCEEAHLSLDAAEALADRLRDLVAAARGSKRARDIVVGDRIVWAGIPQTVVITLADGECCCCDLCPFGDDRCPGSYAFETDASGDGNWIGRRAFHPDTLIRVAATGTPQAVTA